MIDNKNIWNTIKPLFSDNILQSGMINVIENNEQLSCDQLIADIWNSYFCYDIFGLLPKKGCLTMQET